MRSATRSQAGWGEDLWTAACLTWAAVALGVAVHRNGARAPGDLGLVLAGLALAALSYWLRSRSSAPATSSSLSRWMVLLLPCWVGLQLIPLPLFLLKVLSPERASALQNLRPVAEPPALASLSVEPEATFLHLYRLAGYLLVFLLSRDLTARLWPRRSWSFVWPLILIAALEAGIGIDQSFSGAGERVRGTYVNRNHFAGLMEMTLPICLACAMGLLRRERRDRGWYTPWALAGYLALCTAAAGFVALVRSGSKTGFAGGLIGLFVMGTVWSVTNLERKRRVGAIAVLAAVLLLTFVSMPSPEFIFGLGEGVMKESKIDLEGRAPIWGDTRNLIAHFALLGSGLGTYSTAFLRYQTADVDLHFQFAHNDYIQLAAELGLVGLLVLVFVSARMLWRAVRISTGGADEATRFLGLGCLGAFTAIAVHSFTDFNLYIPANVMVLAWIAGIVSGVGAGSGEGRTGASAWEAWSRGGRIAVGALALVYGVAWSVFEARYREDARAERWFCRFGICNTYAVVSALSGEDGSAAGVDWKILREALRRSPSDPVRWGDLGAAFEREGKLTEARYCFERALQLAPNNPPTRWTVAEFYTKQKENARALELTAPMVEASKAHRAAILAWYDEWEFPSSQVAAALAPYPDSIRAYLRRLMVEKRFEEAQVAWAHALAQRSLDLDTVRGYLSFLMNARLYDVAAEAWAGFLGDRREGYRTLNWVYNGSFEQAPSGSPLDWTIGEAESTETSLDPEVAHTGKQSLRIRFSGKDNVHYQHVSQTVVVGPGAYRLQAYIRTEGITTSEGVRLLIDDAEDSARLRMETEPMIGSRDWTKIEVKFAVGSRTRALRIQALRRPVRLKFDQRISGTAWVDSVTLEPLR